MVQVAPIYADGTGWGVEARRNVPAFSKLVWEVIEEMYGPGVGAYASFHDFGERGFAKQHPHVDLTLNGWRTLDGKTEPVAKFDLRGSGRRRWEHAVVQRATRFHVDAQRGSFDLQDFHTGIPAGFRSVFYQVRELVDFTKIHYSRDQQLVYWVNYRDGSRQKFTVKEFLDGFIEYQETHGPWHGPGKQRLHRAFGHLAKSNVRKTQAVMQGVPMPHGKSCPCAECDDWEPVYDDPFTQDQPEMPA